MLHSAEYWIHHLELKSHPEGGYYKEIYRSDKTLSDVYLNIGSSGSHTMMTSIYYLLQGDDFSTLHRIRSDEVWTIIDGSTAEIISFSERTPLKVHKLGFDVENGEYPQVIVQAGLWFGTKLTNRASYILTSCIVAPGFEFADFEPGDRKILEESFPQYWDRIRELTR